MEEVEELQLHGEIHFLTEHGLLQPSLAFMDELVLVCQFLEGYLYHLLHLLELATFHYSLAVTKENLGVALPSADHSLEGIAHGHLQFIVLVEA